MDYHWWFIAALVFTILEMFTIGFVLGCIAVGAFVAGIVAVYVPDLQTQLIVFTVVSIGFGLGLRPLTMKFFHRPRQIIETNVSALINQPAIILEPPAPLTGVGRVLVAGESWRAQLRSGADPGPLAEKGARATVIGVQGATLLIEPADPASIPPHADSQLSF